jgi:TatD DNase family protein
MIDSHCHLAGTQFTEDLEPVVARARARGVDQALVILAADDLEELWRARAVTAAWPEVRYAIGVHPQQALKFADDPAAAAAVVDEAVARAPLTRAIGEIGLDYHYDLSPQGVQRAVFRQQIRLARRRGLPIVIHTRKAEEDTFRILEREAAHEVGGVFHCFTGGADMASRAIELGFYLSFSGIVTFPRALDLREVARDVPLHRLLIETDSPYLAPVPHRGTRNEPAHVACVAQTIALLRGIELEEVAWAARDNFQRLFKP